MLHFARLRGTTRLLGFQKYLLQHVYFNFKFIRNNRVFTAISNSKPGQDYAEFHMGCKKQNNKKKWEQKCQMTQEFFLNVSCRRENAVNHWANLGQFPLFSIQWEMRCAFIGQKWCYILLALGGKLTVSFPVTRCTQPRVRRRWRARHAQRRKYASIHK